MRYAIYLVVTLVMQIVAWIITPVLPRFSERRYGYINNASYQGRGPRLKKWLAWFDTPDNPLDGDERFLRENGMGYWQKVRWLYRNSLYGFKWSVLSAPMEKDAREIHGESPTWSKPGFQRISMNGYWQWHLVKVIWPVTINWNFGWLLNDGDKERALFMFSPRLRLVWRR